MSIPGTVELGTFSGQQQPMKNSSAIPIRKRRFPIFHPCSPPGGEKDEFDSKNKEESKVEDEVTLSSEANNDYDASLVESKTFAVDVIKKDTPLKLANKDILESMSINSLGPPEDLGNTKVILQNEKSYEPDAIPLKKRRFSAFHPCSPPQEENSSALDDLSSKNNDQDGETSSSEANNTASLVNSDVMKKVISHNGKWLELQVPDSSMIAGGQTNSTSQHQLSGGKMDVELSLGPKSSKQQQNEVVLNKSDKVDSLLSLALHEEKLNLHDKKQDSAIGSISNPVSANRSNWDLNTTMDVWEGSTCSDEFAHGIANISGHSKAESCHDDKSLLTVDGAARHASTSSKLYIQQCKMDDSLGPKLVMPYVDTSKEHSSLSDNIHFTSGSPNLSLKQVQLPVVNVRWIVKSEPVDDNSKCDCSIGRCSSSNMESSKLTFVKRESVNNHSLETILQSSISAEKLDDRRTIKSEMVKERMEETCKSKEAAALPVAKVMRHQESSASSSASAMSVSLLPQSSSPSRLPPCLETTTSGDFANQSEKSLHSKESDMPTAIPVKEDTNQLRLCKLGISSVVDQDKFKLARIDKHTVESYQNADVAGNVEEKMEKINEMLEESFGSVTKSPAVGTVCEKEDEEYEDGEIRDHVARLAAGNAREKIETIDEMLEQESFSSDAAFPQKCVVDTVCEDYSLQESYEVSKVVTDEKRETSVTPDEKLDMSEEDVHETPREEVTCDIQTDGSHGIGIEISGEATVDIVEETWGGEDNLTLSKVEDCVDGQDADKDFNNSINKSRIINLSRPSVLAAPFKAKSISNRLLTSRTGKERYSEFDGEMPQRGNRDEFYGGGSNKFVKDRSLRNSRPAFMRGKGRGSGRFGSSRGEWDSNHNFASESSYGQSDYRVMRRKHAPVISEVDLDRNGYSFPQDDNFFGGNRRKTMNSEFHSLRRGSLRRVYSGGERDGPTTRGFQMLHRIPRNMSPRRCSGELDNNQIVRGNRNFSTTLQRKGYPQIRSKSPVRSRTRSPSSWSSPQRRSPNGIPELSQHRSPALYRMGRIRSPDHNPCFHDDMVPRRRVSPSFVARHNNELRDVDSGREHIHPRSVDNTNRGEEPGCFFARSNRKAEALDFREMGDGNEYLNGPSHSNKYYELHRDGSIDNRRKFIDRRGPQRPFRPNYDNDNFQFHPNDWPRPYKFCRDADTEFVERNSAQEREFVERHNAQERVYDERIKHHSVVSRRIRNIEEQEENYRPAETVWHGDGFTDNRVKRRRF